MPEEQDAGTTDANATADAGAKGGQDAPKTEQTLTMEEAQREADRRVNEAHKKWQAELNAALDDKTKDAESKLAELQAKAEEAERKADFLASASDLKMRNPRAAYLVATHGGYISSKGKFDADKFKTDNPEFFIPAANANAGSGAGQQQNGGSDMNRMIRQAAGRL